MELALADAGLAPGEIDYVNAHAHGDRARRHRGEPGHPRVFGAGVPVSSLKGHIGHTLGACGALEAWHRSMMSARAGSRRR